MKKLIFILAFLCLKFTCLSQATPTLSDGFYRVTEIVKDSTHIKKKNKQVFVRFNPLFLEDAPDSAQGLIVQLDDYVPLELSEEPLLLDQTDHKKKIQLSFSRMAADKMAEFTSKHIGQHVTLIVEGKALTTHKVRAAITGGKMEITRCDDTACQKIFVQLKDHVK